MLHLHLKKSTLENLFQPINARIGHCGIAVVQGTPDSLGFLQKGVAGQFEHIRIIKSRKVNPSLVYTQHSDGLLANLTISIRRFSIAL